VVTSGSSVPSGSPQSRLLHIGPHKTGTTTVQSAFDANREALVQHGVRYLGAARQPSQAVKAMTGHTPAGPERDAGLAQWNRLLADAFGSGARSVVLSSEFLCEARRGTIPRILEDFANDDTRVVVTLRPLAKILPSQWQQFVQDGSRAKFEDWVAKVLKRYDGKHSKGFWRRHRYDHLVTRWADVIGRDNLTVIVSDEHDLGQLPREFARLLGLPDGMLVPPLDRANRSLSWEETEVIRHFNIALRELNHDRELAGRRELDLTVAKRLAAWSWLKSRPPNPEDHKIELPAFALDRITELSTSMVEGLQATGVQVIGPVEQLTAPPPRSNGSTPLVLDPQVAAQVAVSLVKVTMQRPPRPAPVADPGMGAKAKQKLRAARERFR
jgi:hypothetical protein